MNEKKRVMLRVAYEGTEFHGSAFLEGSRTVEGELLEALESLTGERPEIIMASRTDAGVHALDNIAVFDTSSPIPGDKFAKALDTKLPEDIRIMSSGIVEADFHPRHVNSIKTYEYHIIQSERPNPLHRYYTCHTGYALDVQKMNAAAAYLVGEHDFASFCNPKTQALSTVRKIYSINVSSYPLNSFLQSKELCQAADTVGSETDYPGKNELRNKEYQEYQEYRQECDIDEIESRMPERHIIITVSGAGFLYNMVRIIAGTLMEVGRGRFAPVDVKDMLNAGNREAAGPTAPARGLLLKKYEWGLSGESS